MRLKLTSLQRITWLYILFFVVIAISLVMAVGSPTSKEGWQAGAKDAMRLYETESSGVEMNVLYELATYPDDMGFPVSVHKDRDNKVVINARPAMMDVEIITASGSKVKGLGLSTTFVILSGFMYIAIFIIIFVILSSLRRSIKRGNIMEKQIIPLTRWIGILLIGASLLLSFSTFIEKRAIAPFFADSGYTVSTSFSADPVQLITGILIFVIAEIFAIGYSLGEEQKLTI